MNNVTKFQENQFRRFRVIRVKGTNMGSCLFSVSKNHYLPEIIRNIQREQKKTYVTFHEKTPLSGEKFELYFFAEWG